MRFRSGMLGCCVVVLALLGTVLGGFVLGIEPDTRTVTDYEYVTDVTGLFDITDTPEYVTYSPSSNLVGYSPSSAITYTPSSTVNSYRYVVQAGVQDSASATVDYNSSYASDTGRFLASEAGTSGLINWDGSIDFGSTTTWHGNDYNATTASESVQVGEYMGSMPMITSLSNVIRDLNLSTYNALDIELTYGTMPILFYYGNWTFTNVERGDEMTQYLYNATLNEGNSMPTSMHVNMATFTVTAYRNDTQMWNVSADLVDVIYRYSTRAGGSFSPASDASVTFDITAIGYPTYGYMDPTKGITMSNGVFSAEHEFPTDIHADYDLANVFPLNGANESYAYIYNYNGWGGAWSGSVTMAGYTLQGVIPRNPNGTGIAMQTIKDGIITPFGLTDTSYGEYTIDFANSTYPIYMDKIGINNLPLNFIRIGNYLDPDAHQLLELNYLETAWSVVIDRIIYDSVTDVVTAYSYNGSNYVVEWTADADDCWMVPMYYLLDSSLQSVSPTTDAYYVNPAPIDTEITISAERPTVATWTNGYKNDEITMSIQRENLNGNDLTITADTSYVTIRTDNTGYMTAEINGSTINIGQWKYLQLTISSVNGTLSLTPLTRISFTAPSNTTNATITIDGWYSGDPIESLEFSTTSQSLRWQITQTTVFLDTFNSVMFNPVIDITDYFPDIVDWRLNFYSFAIYGDSFSINNIPFTVNRSNATVSFTLDDKDYTMALQNVYVTNVDGHMSLTFANNKKVFDLGETVTETISFTGLWFFTTGYYKAISVTEDYYDWQLDGLWHSTGSQSLVIYIALLVLGLIVLKGIFGVKIGSIDGIVIIFAGIIGTMVVI